MSVQPLIHDIPQNIAAADLDLAATTPSATPPDTAMSTVHDEAARTVGGTVRLGMATSDVVAALTDISSGVLATVAAAQYASVAWARGRWLTGHAPTHPVVATLDSLQATLGQSPSLHALRTQHTVTIPDTDHETRWPMFAARAAQVGVGSMMSLPLSVRAEGFGVLNLYATRPHAFTSDDETTAAAFATRAAIALYQAAERDHVQAMASRDVIVPSTDIPMPRHHVTTAVFDWLVRDSYRASLRLPDLVRRLVHDHAHPGSLINPSQTAERPGRLDTVTTEVANGLRVIRGTIADAVVVQASGEVDLLTAPSLAGALRAGCVATTPPGLLVIDLTGIRFFSAAGLTVLLATQLLCRERQVALRVVANHRSVLLPLRITGVDTLFDIAPTLAEATRSLGA